MACPAACALTPSRCRCCCRRCCYRCCCCFTGIQRMVRGGRIAGASMELRAHSSRGGFPAVDDGWGPCCGGAAGAAALLLLPLRVQLLLVLLRECIRCPCAAAPAAAGAAAPLLLPLREVLVLLVVLLVGQMAGASLAANTTTAACRPAGTRGAVDAGVVRREGWGGVAGAVAVVVRVVAVQGVVMRRVVQRHTWRVRDAAEAGIWSGGVPWLGAGCLALWLRPRLLLLLLLQ